MGAGSSEGLMDCSCSSHGGFLTAKGLKEAAQRELQLDAVDSMDTRLYLDKVGSVSALVEVEGGHMCDQLIDEQYRRFLNGS